MLWLVVVAAVAAEDPTLPGALPPLDDALLQSDDSAVSAFGHGRLRAVAEDGDADPVAGAGLTGRVGAQGSLGDVRAVVVVGDGGWWVVPTSGGAATATTTPGTTTTLDLVRRPLVPFLQRLSIDMPLRPLGAPGQLVVGRFPLVIADGRLVGSEGFDARGRSVDGAVLDTALAPVLVRTGVVVLDLGANDFAVGVVDPAAPPVPTPLSALGFVDAAVDMPSDDVNFDDVNVDVYLLAHHQGTTLRPTLGARGSVDVWGLRLKGGLDGQLALDEQRGLARDGSGLHGEVAVRTLLPWTLPAPRPFVEAAVEGTGDVLAPAPTQHGTLGNLDLVGFANTWQVIARAGVDDDATGFSAVATWRTVRSMGEIKDPRGLVVRGADDKDGALFASLDVDLGLPVSDAVDLDVGWSVAVTDGLAAQRLLIGLRFSFGDDDGLLPQF